MEVREKVEQQNNKQTKQTKLNFQTHGEEEEKKKSFIFTFLFIHVFQFISLICFVYLI